ncbi:MAG: hypothetical protein IJ882_08195 [Paludibacteraceae bacterium]|nr:hypothetical protein [Paludibacteraceae bacterium]
MNIFELINKNIVTVSEDVHALMREVAALRQDMAELRSIFNAPEQPNVVPGEEGASVQNRGQQTA